MQQVRRQGGRKEAKMQEIKITISENNPGMVGMKITKGMKSGVAVDCLSTALTEIIMQQAGIDEITSKLKLAEMCKRAANHDAAEMERKPQEV